MNSVICVLGWMLWMGIAIYLSVKKQGIPVSKREGRYFIGGLMWTMGIWIPLIIWSPLIGILLLIVLCLCAVFGLARYVA